MHHNPHKLLPYALLLLIPALLLVVDPEAYRSFNAPKQHLLVGGVMSVLAIWLGVSWYHRRELQLWWSWLEILLVVRLGWLMLTRPSWVAHPSDMGFWLLLSLTLLALLTARSRGADWEQWFLPVLTSSLAAAALVGLFQQMAFWGILLPASVKTPVVGTIGAANGFGLLMAMGILCGGWYLLRSHNHWVRCAGGTVVLVCAPALGFNGSRGALLSLVGAAVVAGWIWMVYFDPSGRSTSRWRSVINVLRRHRYLTAGALLIVTGVLAGWLYQFDSESSRGRLMVWELSLPMIGDHPLTGIGQGRYSVEYLDYQARFFAHPEHTPLAWKAANLKQAHNEYLQAFAESGIPGGLLFAGIWMLGIRRYIQAFKSSGNERETSAKTLLFMTLLLLIVMHSFIDTPLHVLPVAVIAYLLLGCSPGKRKALTITTGWKQAAIAVPLIGLCLVGIYRTAVQYPGYRSWQEGIELGEDHEWAAAITNYRSALETLPAKGELQFHLGSALVMDQKYSKGLYYLKEAREHFSDRNLYLSKSHAWLALGNLDKAEKQARKARAMFPDHLAPRLLLARIAHRRGHHKEARRHLEACINQETRIRSNQTQQIADEARRYREQWYGSRINKNEMANVGSN